MVNKMKLHDAALMMMMIPNTREAGVVRATAAGSVSKPKIDINHNLWVY